MNVPARVGTNDIEAKKLLRVSGKLREAIEVSITEGLPWPEAAQKVGLTTRAMRKALDKPHVLRHIRERKAQFRAEISTRNEHRLGELRDQNDNRMAAVAAIKTLEQLERDDRAAPAASRHVIPGVVVVVQSQPTAPTWLNSDIIEVNPASNDAPAMSGGS